MAACQAKLRLRGVLAYVCNAGETRLLPGDDWEDGITRAMAQCTLFVVLGTKTYGTLSFGLPHTDHEWVAASSCLQREARRHHCAGAEGHETIDTKKELSFALRSKKQLLLIKMTDEFAVPYTQARPHASQTKG